MFPIFFSNSEINHSLRITGKLARYGRSKEKRYDCPLVVFTGVINPQGFLRHSRIYEGNKADPDTMEDMLRDLDQYSDPAHKKNVVLDAGIAAEQNLELIQGKAKAMSICAFHASASRTSSLKN